MSAEKKQITDTVDKLEKVLDLFYQQSDNEAFEKFTKVIDDMIKAIESFEKYKIEHPDFEIDEQRICDILTEAMNALQANDKVLMADILQYDFIEYVNDLADTIE